MNNPLTNPPPPLHESITKYTHTHTLSHAGDAKDSKGIDDDREFSLVPSYEKDGGGGGNNSSDDDYSDDGDEGQEGPVGTQVWGPRGL